MNLQQAVSVQPKSSANGFVRPKAERDGGARLENKLQSGKSNPNRSSNAGAMAGGNVGVYESPSRDRLVYLATSLMGHPVEVQLKNGSIYSGTFHTTNIEKEFAIILKMARLTRDVSFRGQKAEFVTKAPSKTLIIPGKEVVQVMAMDVSVTMDGMSNQLQHEKQKEILLDSYISQSRHVEMERELAPWVPDEDDLCPELGNIFDGPKNRGWDQFKTNEILFGVKSTFDEDLYTTKLERGPQMREREKEAMRIAREIEGEETIDVHLAEERGINLHENFDIDEEARFASVNRGTGVDDSGYEEVEDILLDSHNSETFGDTFTSSSNNPADWSHEKSNDEDRVLSYSSLDDAQSSQSSNDADLYSSDLNDHVRQLASELSSKSFPTSDGENRIPENQHGKHGSNDSVKEFVEEQAVAEDDQLPTFGDSLSSPSGKKNGSAKGELSHNVNSYASASQVSAKTHEKTSSSGELSEGVATAKAAGEMQSVNSRGRPGSSSSNSDCVGAASASSGPGLSPSSSMGSFSSEKSTLNPHAKEFKLNPNAKSFSPYQVPVRPPSPVSDGSFYFPTNVPAFPHMHGMPLGIGIGPSFSGHQPVRFNQQVAPLPTPQAYFHPGGLQYSQPMVLGQHRPFMYMPSFPPEMPYKGREF